MARRWRSWLRGRGRPPAPAAGPAGRSGGGGGTALVASDMFTPGRAGGRDVLVWEGSVAAPASPLGWHSSSPVEVFFHTGHQPATQELASEFTRQLDRQLSALSLLSAERLLEGIRAYRTQGRQPNSGATRKRRKKFMDKVVNDLQNDYRFSEERALAETARIDKALVVLHESDQVTYGPSQPATTTEGWPSLGHGVVNSSLGGQNKPVATVLEQAALQVPPDQRPRVRLLLRAVLTASPALAHQLRHGQVVLEPRPREQVSATSPRGPPWTPAHVAAALATGHDPWNPPPPAQAQPGQDPPGADLARAASLREASFPHPPTAAVRVPPPRTGQPSRPLTPEEVLADIKARAAQTAQQPAQARTPRQTPTRKPRRNRGLGR